ncbi:ribonuclease D [Verrucomicrobiota bacterium sgz303538]
MTAPFLDAAHALESVLPQFTDQPRIAVDTEADSLHCYFEKLCLVQISIPGSDFLIDPLAGFSLEPLFQAFAGKELVFHGADYDLRLLKRNGFTEPTRLFDTMIAARLCGIMEFSLAALIKRFFDLELTKASQKANWARRPLPPQMLEYAVNDTRFLLKLADILKEELCRLGRWIWFEQSCARAILAANVIKERDPEQLWRISGSHELRGRASAILRALWHWREEEAQSVDRPTFHILHNEQLVHAADRFDRGLEVDIKSLRGSRRKRFFEAGERALAIPETEWPRLPKGIRRPRPTPAQEDNFRALKQKRDAVAGQLQLDPALIAPKSVLEAIAFEHDEALSKLMTWQRELLDV